MDHGVHKVCLGIPPSTYLPDGKALLDQSTSRVTLFISGDVNAATFEITVQRSIGSPADLLKLGTSPQNPPGMVTLEWFGRMICQNIGGETSEAHRAMCQALPYALKHCCHLLQLGKKLTKSVEFGEYATKAFPQESVTCNVLTQMLYSNNQQHLKRFTEGHVISDLPLVQLHLRRLAEICDCEDCISAGQTPKKRNFVQKLRCYKDEIFL